MEKIKVLMIDDNYELVEMVKEYFSSHENIKISLTSNDSTEGMKLISERQDDYDLIVLDLIMPIRDGVSILEEMKKTKERFFKFIICIPYMP